MGDEESFLQRWLRRKQANRSASRGQPAAEPREEGVGPDEEDAGRTAAKRPSPAAESSAPPSPLAPINTIDRGTDIRPFLAVGVPEEITSAALRRAWSADPAIRDFVGLSENFWEATSGDGIPGFGSLTLDKARDLLKQLTGTLEAPDGPQQSQSVTSEGPQSPARKAVDG